MNPFAALADPTYHAAAFAWHQRQPRGKPYGEFQIARDCGNDPSELDMPDPGTSVHVVGGPRDGLRAWMLRRKDRFCAILLTQDGERIAVHGKYLRTGGASLGPMPVTKFNPPRRQNRYGLKPGSRAEVIGGKHRGRFGNIVKVAGGTQVIVLLDNGTRIAPTARFVRVLP
jgi:hypothetical protein